MIDWVSVDVPDPIGMPVNAGQVLSVSQDGEIEWTTSKRLQVKGSWSSSMTFRALGCQARAEKSRATSELLSVSGDTALDRSPLQISGNPAKFLHGHNLFGTDDLQELLTRTVAKARGAIWPNISDPPAVEFSEGTLSRIDLTASWLLDRAEDVMPVLRAMEETVWCPHRGRGVFDTGGSTLYYGRTDKGKRSKAWQLKLYWKGAEVGVHKLPHPAYCVPGLLEDLHRTIRVELTLRTPELKRLDLLKVGQWTPAKVAQLWELYVGKLDFGQSTVNLDAVDLAQFNLKPRHTLALAAWRAGNDLRPVMPPRGFYRLRRELLDMTGFDIALVRPKSNVVPLRRIVELKPASVPRWAEPLTEALNRAVS